MQRLEYKGSTLKPVQIVEEVLDGITHEDRVDAIIQGKSRDLSILNFQVQCFHGLRVKVVLSSIALSSPKSSLCTSVLPLWF